jgi:hypothetical protein
VGMGKVCVPPGEGKESIRKYPQSQSTPTLRTVSAGGNQL